MSDRYLGMLDMRRDVQGATRDQLVACVLELLDDPDVNQSVHLLAAIGRNTGRRGYAQRGRGQTGCGEGGGGETGSR